MCQPITHRCSARLRGIDPGTGQRTGPPPDFRHDRTVYLSYAEGGGAGDKAGTGLGRGQLSEDLKTQKDFKVIFRQEPKLLSATLLARAWCSIVMAIGSSPSAKTTTGQPPRTSTSCKAKLCGFTRTARCRTTTLCWSIRRASGNLVVWLAQPARCGAQCIDRRRRRPALQGRPEATLIQGRFSVALPWTTSRISTLHKPTKIDH